MASRVRKGSATQVLSPPQGQGLEIREIKHPSLYFDKGGEVMRAPRAKHEIILSI